MIYKVYANCVRVAKAITEITEEDVKEYIAQEMNEFFDHNDLDFLPHNEDDEFEDLIWNKCHEAVYDLIDELWKKNRILECGDFKIVEADEAPSRPDMCGGSSGDIDKEDIIAKIFEEIDNFEFEVPDSELMSDEELCEAVYGTDDEEELEKLTIKDDNFFPIAIRDYGKYHLNGIVVKHLVIKGIDEEFWHTSGTLYMTSDDSGLSFDLWFKHKPDEDDVIKAICVNEGITDDLKILKE